MSVSPKKMTRVLGAMACLFVPPTPIAAQDDLERLGALWVGLLDDYFDDESITDAALNLSRTLRKFPVPADFLELAPLYSASVSKPAACDV